MSTVGLLANPGSGMGEAERVGRLLRELGADVREFRVDQTEQAIASRPERLIVAGGDGSLAGAAAAARGHGIPLAVIPTGTANDFARRFGIPRELESACRLAVHGTTVRRLDLGWMADRPFLNAASIGLPPAAARRASGLKRALGPLAYFLGALRAGLSAQPVGCVVRCDGEELLAGEAWQVTVACSGAFGAGSSVDANPRDGMLDAVVVEARSRLRLGLHAYGLRTGKLGAQNGARQRRCTVVELELPGRQSFNVDGELVESGSCAFEVEPAAVEIVLG